MRARTETSASHVRHRHPQRTAAFILLLFGSPGLPLGAIAGALIWRRHRVWGALIGAVAGFGLWLLGGLYVSSNL
ncbi:MAG TPA: hypothetical protein VHW95_03875 [Steroidobacteraceae bacterium]|nr:hypothetical protein [Steroidobacteraceae bacterium]